ncbi:kinase-like domain-containing protein [Syncephalis pseudoplumigaleata]|uniref:Kinase-like domain-containing protein n=1 Tax=Syncephalis pseudoplumigaleata TaxID=1712513 RepID=A0A4P9YTF7_9FUNG|nr:kinase-like domain-containing protein [Syncephalis pseudoplumigaleata]|eukprot:RKP23273.1 kinase-like domain-containing protein [Syncephalis pseudoplumigaleata]
MGAFGNVYKGVLNKTGRLVAIKQMKRKDDSLKEWDVMAKLAGHPHILRAIALVERPTHVTYVLELAKGGDLFSYAEDKGFEVPEEEAQGIVRQIVAALLHINKCGIAHLDLKLENVLFQDKNHSHILLADFGAAEVLGESSAPITRPVGTPRYMAPEVLRCCPKAKGIVDEDVPHGFGMLSDNWSLGVLVYVLLHGRFPFAADGQAQNSRDLLQGILHQRTPFAEATEQSRCSADARDFINRLLQISPARRMTLAEACKHPWLKGAQAGKHSLDDPASGSSSTQSGKRPRLG